MNLARSLSRMRLVPLLFLLLGTASHGADDSVVTRTQEITKLAAGVYTIRHPDATDDFPEGNTTVIIGARDVLVVDSCYLPSTARADIAQIRQWTDKPVRYILNTHWHFDHNGGNASYLDAFPMAAIVAHTETRAMMAARVPSYVTRYAAADSVFGKQRAELAKSVATGLDASGKVLTAAEKSDAAQNLALKERAASEFRNFVFAPPSLAFDHALDIDLGNREVQLRFLGRGNTGGDVVAYLPAEKILIAGDLLDSPVPYAFGGYPTEWIRTLQAMALLDFTTAVPGHGRVLAGKEHLRDVIDLLQTVVTATNAAVSSKGSAATPDDVVKSIDLSAFRRRMAGADKESQEFFDESIASLVRIVFAEVKAR
jgi:glyoxylase-like metal-dependent hydrolase (beta-lactamase superfamily II)